MIKKVKQPNQWRTIKKDHWESVILFGDVPDNLDDGFDALDEKEEVMRLDFQADQIADDLKN